MNRLNSRERFLIIFLAAALFVVINWTLLGVFASRYAGLKANLAAARADIRSMQSFLAGDEGSATRDAWLTASQPKLGNPEQAGVQLLDQVKEIARANEVLLENPELGSVEPQAARKAVSVQLTAKGSWANLVKFMHALQAPGQFIVFETATLQVDPSDAKRMNGRFKIAKWYAP